MSTPAWSCTEPKRQEARMTRLIDLSQPIFEGMKVYPEHLKTLTFRM
jgi:hypothetical protein